MKRLKVILECIAVLLSFLMIISISLLCFCIQATATVIFDVLVVFCWLRSMRQHPKHIPFSSPGFLAAFVVTLFAFGPSFEDATLIVAAASLLMLSLSLLILLVSVTTRKRQKTLQSP